MFCALFGGSLRGAAVADADVEIAVRSEREHAAVVIRVGRVRDRQQHRLGRAGRIRDGRRRAVLGDARAFRRRRACSRRRSVRCVAYCGWNARPSSPCSPPETIFESDVEEHRRRRGAGLQHLDDARLLDDEEAVRAVARIADEHRTREA